MIAWITRKGQITIDILKLNRPALIERRSERLKKIDLMRQKYETEKNEDYKRILLDEIEEEIGNDKEYSFVLQEYWRAVCG